MSDLADRLLAGAAVQKKGGFTVDVEKARTKMERFRLANPLLYTVELVQAAVLSGAKAVTITVDADDFTMEYVAERPLGMDDLTDLESAILVRNAAAHPARLQLALATSAAQALRPGLITFVGTGATMTIKRETTTLTPTPATNTMRFTLHEAFRAQHLVEFFAGLVGKTPEEKLLRERCRFATTEIRVNGAVISGQAWPGDLAVDVLGRGQRGAVGFLADPHEQSRLFLLRAGVLQEEIPWAEATKKDIPTGLFAVIDGEHLARDASFTRFVRGKEFTALVDSLERSIERTAPLLEPGILGGDERALARAAGLARWLGVRVFQKELHVLADAPLLRDPVGRPLTLRALKAVHDDKSHVLLRTGRGQLGPELIEDDVIVQVGDGLDEQLVKRMGWTTADADALIGSRRERHGRYHDFKNRPGPTVIDDHCIRRLTVTRDALRIELGLRSGGPADCALTVVVDGCRLVTLSGPCGVERLSILVTGPFTPNQAYDDVVRDAVFSDAVAHAIAALPALLDGPYSDHERGSESLRGALRALLDTSTNGDALWRTAAEAFGVGPRARGLSTLSLDGAGAHGAVTFPLIPLFPTGTTTLARLRGGKDPLGVVSPGAPTFRPTLKECVVADGALLVIIRKVVGSRPVMSLEHEAEQVRRQNMVLTRPPSARQVDGVTVHAGIDETVKSGDERLRRVGFVGFVANQQDPGTRLRVFFRGRLLQDRMVPGPIPGLVAAIDDESITLNADLRPTDLQPLADRALAEVPALVEKLASARHASVWVLARRLVELAFPTDVAPSVWRRLASTTGKQASAAWRAILEHLERIEPSRVDNAIASLLAAQTTPSAQALFASHPAIRAGSGRTAALGPAFVEAGIMTGLLQGFRLGSLELPRLAGGSVTLATLVNASTVRITDRGGRAPAGFEDVIIADAAAAVVLRRVCESVEDVSEELARALAREAFQARATRTTSIGPHVDLVARRIVDEEGLRGEIGLLSGPGSLSPKANIEILREGRALTRIELGDALGVAATGIFESDTLTPNADFTGIVSDRHREAFINRLRDLVAELCAAFAADVDQLRAPRSRGRILEYLVPERKRSGEAKVASWLMEAPILVSVKGEPVTLASRTKKKPLRILTKRLPGMASALADAVVVESEQERNLLDRIVPTTIVNEQWMTEVLVEERKSRLEPLPDLLSLPHLHSSTKTLGSVRLTLVVPDPMLLQSTLHVGDDGLLVETIRFPGPLHFSGVVEASSAIDNWQRANLGEKLRLTIRREVVGLWAGALTAFTRQGKRSGDDSAEARERMRQALFAAAHRVLGFQVSDLTSDEVALRSRLRGADLLSSSTGGMISFDDAIESRSDEHLGMLIDLGLVEKNPRRPRPPTPPPAPEPAPPPAPLPAPAQTPHKAPAKAQAEPPAKKKAPEPTEVLRARLLAELRIVRRGSPHLLSDTELERLLVRAGPGKHLARKGPESCVVVDLKHPVATAALTSPAALVVLAAACTSALNAVLATFTDDEERSVLLALARHARTVDAGAVLKDNLDDVVR